MYFCQVFIWFFGVWPVRRNAGRAFLLRKKYFEKKSSKHLTSKAKCFIFVPSFTQKVNDMKNIALVILPNQNDVSKSEIEKIRRAVKKDFPESRLKVYANDDAENLDRTKYDGFPDVKEDDVMVFRTQDVNYSVSARLEENYSTVSGKNSWYIQLN